MIFKLGSIAILFLITSFNSIDAQAFQQYYTAYLNPTLNERSIVIDADSEITWGAVNKASIEISEVSEVDNGFIEFNIGQAAKNAIVSLDSQSGDRYGIHFDNSTFHLVIGSIDQQLPSMINGYSEMNTFKVEKCGSAIKFYKDQELLFVHCIVGVVQALVHRTTTSVNSIDIQNVKLELIFESDFECSESSLIFINDNNESSRGAGFDDNRVESRNGYYDELIGDLKPLREYIVTFYNIDDSVSFQTKFTTSKKGIAYINYELKEKMKQASSYRIKEL